MDFVKFTRTDTQKTIVAVNPIQVVYVGKRAEDQTNIYFDSDDFITVNEGIDKVITKLKKGV